MWYCVNVISTQRYGDKDPVKDSIFAAKLGMKSLVQVLFTSTHRKLNNQYSRHDFFQELRDINGIVAADWALAYFKSRL